MGNRGRRRPPMSRSKRSPNQSLPPRPLVFDLQVPVRGLELHAEARLGLHLPALGHQRGDALAQEGGPARRPLDGVASGGVQPQRRGMGPLAGQRDEAKGGQSLQGSDFGRTVAMDAHRPGGGLDEALGGLGQARDALAGVVEVEQEQVRVRPQAGLGGQVENCSCVSDMSAVPGGQPQPGDRRGVADLGDLQRDGGGQGKLRKLQRQEAGDGLRLAATHGRGRGQLVQLFPGQAQGVQGPDGVRLAVEVQGRLGEQHPNLRVWGQD